MSQKIDSLMQLLVAKESDELRELKRFKERSKGVEAELALAKSRVTELESRVEGLVRSEAKATQSGEDSQRQIQDYEAKLQKLEREIEPLRRLDDAQKTRDREFEQIRLQLQSQEIQEVRSYSSLEAYCSLFLGFFAPKQYGTARGDHNTPSRAGDCPKGAGNGQMAATPSEGTNSSPLCSSCSYPQRKVICSLWSGFLSFEYSTSCSQRRLVINSCPF